MEGSPGSKLGGNSSRAAQEMHSPVSSGHGRDRSSGADDVWHRRESAFRSPSRAMASEFPTLAESLKRSGKRGISLLLDKSSLQFKQASNEDSFPLEAIERSKVKLKAVPIELCWSNNGGQKGAGREFDVGDDKLKRNTQQKSPNTERWFRAPPKVRFTAGILGQRPNLGTRVGNLEWG